MFFTWQSYLLAVTLIWTKYLGLTFAGLQNNECFFTQTVQSCSSPSFLVINRGHESDSAFPCALCNFLKLQIQSE